MDLPHPLPDALVEHVAARFRVIGEPMRIRLLERMRDGGATVGELVEALGTSQQNVSKHLGVLYGAGIVKRTKEGTHVRYTIDDPTIFALCDLVCGGLRAQIDAMDELLGTHGSSAA